VSEGVPTLRRSIQIGPGAAVTARGRGKERRNLPMQDERSMDPTDVLPVSDESIFERLTRPNEQRPWSVGELVLELRDSIGVEDTLTRLHAVGLIHRCGEFVWATRAALAAEAMEL
jgi:hypothetical protein